MKKHGKSCLPTMQITCGYGFPYMTQISLPDFFVKKLLWNISEVYWENPGNTVFLLVKMRELSK